MNSTTVTPIITPRMTCLLDYTILTDPSPLHTGQRASFDIVVSNPTGQPIFCNQISVVFRIGDNAQDLAASSEHLTNLDVFPLLATESDADPDFYDWTTVRIQDEVITLVPQQEHHTFLPAGQTTGGTRGIRIHAENILINTEPGTSVIDVLETATTQNQPWPDSPAASYLPTMKHTFTDKVTAGSVALWTLQNGRLVTQAQPGAVTLQWDGPRDLSYAIQRDHGQAIEVKAGEVSYEFDSQHPIVRDTTFTLIDAATKTPLATTSLIVTTPTYAELTLTGELDGSAATSSITEKLHATKELAVDHKLLVQQTWNVDGTLSLTRHGRVAR